jgi:hypothetical protein
VNKERLALVLTWLSWFELERQPPPKPHGED